MVLNKKKGDKHIYNINKDISHLLYHCQLANYIWQSLSKKLSLQRQISVADVMINEHCEPHIVDVVTIDCHGIFNPQSAELFL